MEQTQQPYSINMDALSASKIMAEAELHRADARKREAEITKMIEDSIKEQARFKADLARMAAEREKTAAERAKIERETAWYPLIAMASAMGAGAAIMAGAVLLLKYLTTP